ncbi:hypothetical protein ACQJBY_002824 [Aegilops geniculata]
MPRTLPKLIAQIMAMLYPKDLSDASRALPRTLAILCPTTLPRSAPPRPSGVRPPPHAAPDAASAPLLPSRGVAAAPCALGRCSVLLQLRCSPAQAWRSTSPAGSWPVPPPRASQPASATHAHARMLADEAPPLWLSSAPPSVRSPPRTGSARSTGPPPRDPPARLRPPARPRVGGSARADCGRVPARPPAGFGLPSALAPAPSRSGLAAASRTGFRPPAAPSPPRLPAPALAGPARPRGRLSARRPHQRAPAAPRSSRLLWPAPEEKKREAGCPTRGEEEKTTAG